MRRSRAVLVGFAIGVLIILVVEGFGLAGEPRPAPSARAAVINGEVITLAEVDDVLKQRPTPLMPRTAAQLKQVRSEALSTLIDDLLIRQFMRDHGPKIDAGEVDRQLGKLEAALTQRGKSLAEYLKEQNQTLAQVRAGMLMLLQLDQYVKQHTTDAELRRYWDANKDFFDKVTVRTSHVVIRVPADAPAAEREKARQKLRALRADIVAGKLDFAAAAKQYSQCPSAPKGGDIGTILRKFQNVDEAYARAAFALKVGEVSDVVETEFGVHLIKVTERSPGQPSKFEACAEDVRDSYADELRVALLQQLRKKAKIEITLP